MLSDKCTKSNRSALQGKEKKTLDRHNQNFVGKILQHIFIHIKTIFITHITAFEILPNVEEEIFTKLKFHFKMLEVF